MSNSIQLTGTGAAYIRVSTEQQDTVRQYDSIGTFTTKHKAAIPEHNWFKDEGWARDTADHRPEFQRLLKLAEAGAVRWVVVDKLDRFGTKDPHQLVHYLFRLRECGCKLFDVSGKEWTGADIATIITAVVEGEKSKGEQTEKSHRVLNGKIAGARAGEWQGGHVRLGFDVGCYSRETGKEVWRVVFEGKDKRLKVYPDRRAEPYNGVRNFPQSQPLTEVLRVTPSRDKAKLDAATSVFKRYARESLSFTVLAKHLNDLGFRSSTGNKFHGHHIGHMLADPVYLGHYTWNKTHHGKFHRYTDGRTVAELNYDEKVTANNKADWVQSHRLFEPLVDTETWAAVQAKLDGRTVRAKAPTNPSLYLSGLLHCANCNGRMVVGPKRKQTKKRAGLTDGRLEYLCGTYQRYVSGKNRDDETRQCPCLRNGVFQDVLDGYVDRYLEETGQRLKILTAGTEQTHLTDRLEEQQLTTWDGFCDGIGRLEEYLAKHHPDEYGAIRGRANIPQEEGGPDHNEFVTDVLQCYRDNFDPSRVAAEIARLDKEHTRLTHRYADLPTPRAKEKAKAELEAVEKRIGDLERHRDDMAGVVERQFREMLDLLIKVAEAKIALQSTTGERALRQRAEAVRQVIQRIECSFTATGKTKGGPGRTNARLVAVTIYPLVGEAVAFETTGPRSVTPALFRTRVVPRW